MMHRMPGGKSWMTVATVVALLAPIALAQQKKNSNDGFDDDPAPAAVPTPAPAPAPTPAPPADPAKLKALVQQKLTEFRKPKLDDERRKALAGELLNLGPDAAKLFAPELAKDFAARRKSYLAHFDRAAAKAIEPRIKTPDAKKELELQRGRIMKVAQDRNITLEKINDFSDPARRKIEEMLALPREEVFKTDPTLTPEREMLLLTVGWWREAVQKSPPDAKKSLGATLPPEQAKFEQDLKDEEDLAAVIAGLPDRKDHTILRNNRELAKQLDLSEAKGVFMLNVLRARIGIGALVLDMKLTECARGHSKDMSEFMFFDHVSPVPGREELRDRAKLAGTSASGENIYQGGERGEDAINGWWHSPGHHANMLAPHKRMGLGKHEGYWTQVFGM